MTTVYSKLSKLPDPMAVSQTPKLDNLDVDLIDKIKLKKTENHKSETK